MNGAIVARVARAYAAEPARMRDEPVRPVVEVLARDADPRRDSHPARLPLEDGMSLLEAGSATPRDAWLRLCAARGYGAHLEARAPGAGRMVDVTIA